MICYTLHNVSVTLSSIFLRLCKYLSLNLTKIVKIEVFDVFKQNLKETLKRNTCPYNFVFWQGGGGV